MIEGKVEIGEPYAHSDGSFRHPFTINIPMTSLVELFKKQGNATDKITVHQYGWLYEELFDPIKDKVKSVLEIGIAQGASIEVWKEYFPNATIYALDIEPVFTEKFLRDEQVEAHVVDAGNREQLADWAAQFDVFDIVIDDGSHKIYDILNAYDVLWPTVTPGGIYIIEDAAQATETHRMLGKFYQISGDTTFNSNDVASVQFRPNMIILTKKQIDDPTCPPIGTL